MSYVIYNNETTKILGGSGKTYKTMGAAKAAISRLQNKILVSELGTETDPVNMYSIAETGEFYKSIEKTVERTNLMSGKKFREPVNTPYYCSPSSETYWSS